ncbi:zinc finger protein 449-like [Sciurus carolinensis]|nr:zinc finger protein 449-like [Sciurus carolinensis]XP_047391284.1 zinc finger protein 449-like [Sciurus carolinensis]
MLHDHSNDCEVLRQHFRQFQYTEAAGPREAFSRLWELCCRWLKPKMRSMEQILELLVLEQFLTILPTEMESWVSAYGPESRERLLALIEDWQRQRHIPPLEVDMHDMLLEELAPVGTVPMPPNMHLETSALQGMGPVQEAPVTEAWIPQAGPQELNYGAAGECQPFLDPGHATPESGWSCLLECRGEPGMAELLGGRHVEQAPESRRGFGIGRESKGSASAQGNLGSVQPCLVCLDANAPHAPPPMGCEKLEPPSDTAPEELLSSCWKPVHPPRPCAAGKPLPLAAPKPRDPQEKPHRCGQCGQCFTCKKRLSTHLKIHAGELGYKCPGCEKGFLHRSDLDRHVRIHTGERPYECSLCHKRFIQGAHLTMHQRGPCAKDNYQCHKCSKRFANRANLMGHLKTHTQEKRHECHSCGKRFNRRTALTLHQRTHTQERPFSCQHCEKSYRQRSSLMIHLRIHTGEKPYICSHCSKSFIKKAGLIAHQAAHFREGFPGNPPQEGMSPEPSDSNPTGAAPACAGLGPEDALV